MIQIGGYGLQYNLFPNGEANFKVPIDRLTTSGERMVWRYESDRDFIELMFAKKYLEDNGFHNVELMITYMPYSRMDRAPMGTCFTLKYVCEFINSLNFSKVFVVEPHSDVTPALLNRCQPISYTMELVRKAEELVDFLKEEDYIVFPDAGAEKRYAHLFSGYNTLTCSKQRDFGSGEILALELHGEIKKSEFRAIIVDDLCSYGGTFAKVTNLLRSKGALGVALCVTHCEDSVFYGGNLLPGGNGVIDELVTTDSITRTKVNDIITTIPIRYYEI